MGKSRSATIILAYLLWKSLQHNHDLDSSHFAPTSPPGYSAFHPPRDIEIPNPVPLSDPPLTPETALSLLRQSRPFAEPNDGFMSQLQLYHSMGCPGPEGVHALDSHPKYQRWLYRRTVQASLDIHLAPELSYIRFEDEHEPEHDPDDGDAAAIRGNREVEIKCRKCRRLLAKSNFLVEHHPPPPAGGKNGECAHRFVHPLGWMRPSLGKEGAKQLDGRLLCPNPKCAANVGKFAWQGMRCSCGGWVTPGFALARGRVDEVVARTTADDGGVAPSAPGVRLPPRLRKDGGHL